MDSSSSMWGSPDEAMTRVNQQIAEAQERATRAAAVRVEMDALRGTSRSARGEVEATVDTSGRLIGLELSSDALDLGERELARLILSTAAAAGQKAGALAVELASEAFGETSAITSRFRAEIAERSQPMDRAGSDFR